MAGRGRGATLPAWMTAGLELDRSWPKYGISTWLEVLITMCVSSGGAAPAPAAPGAPAAGVPSVSAPSGPCNIADRAELGYAMGSAACAR